MIEIFEDDEFGQQVQDNPFVTGSTYDSDDEDYCPVCRHFRCPVAKGDELAQHLPDEPCGYYDCCIN